MIPNATVTAAQTTTGYTRTATTDASGQYSILALPPGNYRLTASIAGFENGIVDNVDLNVNDALNFDFALPVGNVSQTVSVDASTVQVETASTSMGTTITSAQILAMPLNGRSYLDLLSLQPALLLRTRTPTTTIAHLLPASTARRETSRRTVARVGQRLPGERRRSERKQKYGRRPDSGRRLGG